MGKYSGYAQQSAGYKILKEFPGLRKEDLEKANGFFEPYIFFENIPGGRKVWTSCCHHRGELWETVPRIEQEENWIVRTMEHNEEVRCPYCHKKVKVKNVKKIGKAKRLEQYIPVLFLHAVNNGETIYAQGYWAWKAYYKEEQWASPPLYMVTRVFRFRRGEWLAWRDQWAGGEKYKMVQENGKWIGEPFTTGSGMMFSYCGYKVVGLEELSGSFLRYTGIREMYEKKDLCEGFIRTLALTALYPEGVEMLLKVGMTRPIEDWVWNRKKNAKTIKWDEKDPRKVFDLNGRELKEFLASTKNLDILEIYKDVRKNDKGITISEVEKQANAMGVFRLRSLVKTMKGLQGLTLRRLTQYLERFTGPRCGGHGVVTVETVAQMWRDYIGFAKILGYDMTNPVIQMPRKLDQKHNEVYAAVVGIREQAERAAEAEKKRSANEKAALRVAALEKRYGYETEQYLIRAPRSATEIVDEGKALCHCVGGYAARHAEGKTTILFLRDKRKPEVPLATIEMMGNELVQVHGYNNERKSHWSNPDRVPARKLYAEILNPWLEWVKAGSKRDKEGKPRMPKKSKKEANAA